MSLMKLLTELLNEIGYRRIDAIVTKPLTYNYHYNFYGGYEQESINLMNQYSKYKYLYYNRNNIIIVETKRNSSTIIDCSTPDAIDEFKRAIAS